MRRSFLTAALLAGILSITVHGAISDFDAGIDGWRVADLPQTLGNPPVVVQYLALNWNATGGNPFGYVDRLDPGDNWFWFAAPSQFLGNKTSAYGTNLTFDLKSTGNDGVPYPGVILADSSFALYQDLNPPATTFTHYSVSLSQTGWHVGSSGGPNATAVQMLQMLGSLNALYIDADWQTGFETTALDNVFLVPEPGCIWILTLGTLLTSKRRPSIWKR